MIPATEQHWLGESCVALGQQLAKEPGPLELSYANL